MELKYYGHSKKSGVYRITNKVNGKIYIGSAKCFQVRASQHKTLLKNNKHQNKHLQASFNKHGAGFCTKHGTECSKSTQCSHWADAFLFEVVEVINGETETRRKREQFFIDQEMKNNWKQCFNCQKKTIINQGPWSYTPEKTKKKLSNIRKKLWENPEYRKQMSASHKGKKHSEKTKEKMSESLKGNKNALGHKRSESVKKQISKKLKNNNNRLGKKHSEETKEKMSTLRKGRKLSMETKEKISLANKGKKRTLEQIEKYRQTHLGKKHSEETKKKISASLKARHVSKKRTKL